MDKTNKNMTEVVFLETKKEWLNLGECAQYLGVTKNTIMRWSRTEGVNFPKPKRISPRKTFYSTALVREWFENREDEQ